MNSMYGGSVNCTVAVAGKGLFEIALEAVEVERRLDAVRADPEAMLIPPLATGDTAYLRVRDIGPIVPHQAN